MKKLFVIFTITLCVFTCMFLVGCDNNNKNNNNSNSNKENVETTTTSISASEMKEIPTIFDDGNSLFR